MLNKLICTETSHPKKEIIDSLEKETFDDKTKTNSEKNNQFVFNFIQQGDNNIQIGYIENYRKKNEK